MFEMILIGFFAFAVIGAAIGFRQGYDMGCEAGWNEGYQFATSDQEIAWQITAKGEAALDAATTEREPLTELSLHDRVWSEATMSFEKIKTPQP